MGIRGFSFKESDGRWSGMDADFCRALELDPVGPLLLPPITSDSAGLLTLADNPATLLVGSSIGMTFSISKWSVWED